MSDASTEAEVIEAPAASRADTFDYGAPSEATDASAGEAEVVAATEAVPEVVIDDPAEDVEIDGKKFQLPKSAAEKLKAERLMQADYTKKTQEVAEQRRALEAHQARVEQQATLQQESLKEYAQLSSIDSQLEQFAAFDWNQANTTDPVETQRLFIHQQQLRDQRATLAGSLQQKEQQKAQLQNQQAFEAQQATARQIEEGRAVLAREIKGWSPELAAKLVQVAKDDGWSQDQINTITPAQIKSLHRSYIGQQLVAKQSAPAQPAPPPKPVPQVTAGGAAARKSPDDMSMAEYAKWRRAQR